MSTGRLLAATEPAVDWVDVSNPAAQVDLVATYGRLSRRIRPLGDGTLVCRTKGGTSRSIAVTENVDEDIQASTIEAATDIDVRVYF